MKVLITGFVISIKAKGSDVLENNTKLTKSFYVANFKSKHGILIHSATDLDTWAWLSKDKTTEGCM